MKKPEGIEFDPDIYTGKDSQHFYIEKSVKSDHSMLNDLIQHIDEYVEVPEDWKSLLISIVLYVADASDGNGYRLFTIQVPNESEMSEHDAFRQVKDSILSMDLIKLHASDEVVKIKNAFYVYDHTTDSRAGELTFYIYLNLRSVQ